MKFVAENESDFTTKIFKAIEPSLKPGFVLGLVGDLGAGKTTLVKAIVKKLHCTATVSSPTFVYMKEYPVVGKDGIKSIRHIDLYRLSGSATENLNEIMEWLEGGDSIVIVEWAQLLSRDDLFDAIISIKLLGNNKREVSIKWK